MNNMIRRNLYLSPDSPQGDIVDPLDVNVADVNTDYPVLRAAVYPFRIEKAEIQPTKDSKDKKLNKGDVGYAETLVISLATTEDHKDIKDNLVPKGHTLRHYIGITPKEARHENGKDIRAYTNDDIKKNVAQVGKAAGISATVREIINNPAQLQGRVVRVNVGIDKETDQFPAQNRVKSFEAVK
jgi:hypothetical protein